MKKHDENRNPIEKVKTAAEVTRENRSSMGQDFDHKRRTEIDAKDHQIKYSN
jgi:ketopantoate reductase